MSHLDDHGDTAGASYLKEVRDHYEEYPYPERAPEDEKKQLRGTVADGPDHINYYCLQGAG